MGIISAFQRMSVDELRAEVITLLKDAYADGRITVETLERRLKSATVAGDKEELLSLIADIPAPSGADGQKEDYGEEREDRPWLINTRVPREKQSFFALLGGSNRNGRWQPAKQIHTLSLLGGVHLDFREAEFPRTGIHITAGCILGGLDIIVPPGINADVSGIPLLGGMENKAGAGDEGAPTITVRGVAILGGVTVKRKELKSSSRRKGRRSRR